MMEPIGSLIDTRHHIQPLEPAKKLLREEKFAKLPDKVLKATGKFMTLKELMSNDYPESSWVVEGLVPEGLTILSAQPGTFKTWLLLDIAISVASGSPLVEVFDTTQGGVLMVDEESSERLLQQRLRSLESGTDLPIYFKIGTNFKLDDAQISDIIKRCKKDNIKLITFDSLVRIHDKNENDAVQMSDVFAKVKRFMQEGINVLIAHHNRKGGNGENPGQEIRGSSDILAAVDCHLSLSMKKDFGRKLLRINQTKLRSSEELEPFEIEVLTEDGSVDFTYVGVSDQSESKRDKIANLIPDILSNGEVLNQKEILAALDDSGNKVNAKTLRKILKYMQEIGRIEANNGRGSEILYGRSRS